MQPEQSTIEIELQPEQAIEIELPTPIELPIPIEVQIPTAGATGSTLYLNTEATRTTGATGSKL